MTILSFLTFLFAIFNSSQYSTYVCNFCIVSFHIIRSIREFCDKLGLNKFLTILPRSSVGFTVAVDKYVNSSVYFFGFYDFFWFMLDLYILGPLKCLMISGSFKIIETTNSLFLRISFLILVFHVFVKHKREVCPRCLCFSVLKILFVHLWRYSLQ